MSTPQRIAIVGAGIAGLTLAAALDPQRFQVTLHEAQPERSDLGAPLGLWPAARRTLTELGVGDRVLAGAGPTPAGALRDLSGDLLARAGTVDVVMVPRPLLLRSLADAIPETTAHRTEAITDPDALDADLVVGADGVRSVVRGLVWPRGAERLRTPYVALRGVAPGAPAPDTIGEYWGPGRLFGIVPVAAESTYWFSTHRSELGPEPLDVGAVLGEADRAFADAAPAIRALLAGAAPSTIATRLWVTPALPRYLKGRYVVIGDAAHGMLPNLGRGACDAIADAASLAASLNAGEDLRLWQARRLPPTQAARAASNTLMRVATGRRVQPARDRLLRKLAG